MPAVSEDGYLVDMTDEEYGKVKKGFTYFENNDVLFAKITPCMENGKGAIVHGLTNGIGMGSTEFHQWQQVVSYKPPSIDRLPIIYQQELFVPLMEVIQTQNQPNQKITHKDL